MRLHSSVQRSLQLCILSLFLGASLSAQSTPSPTSTTLAIDQNTIAQGTIVQLTATVSSSAGAVAAGQVQFYDGYLPIGTVQGVAQSNGTLVATLRTRSFLPGTHQISARFMGARYAAPNGVAQSVSAAGTLTVTGSSAETLSLVQGLDSSGQGILTAAITSSAPLSGTLTLVDQTANVLLGTQPLPGPTQAPLSVTEGTPLPTWGPVVVADLNGDGIPDVAGLYPASNQVGVRLSDPANPGKLLPETLYATGSGPASIVTADFNADGALDLAIGNSDGTITLLFGNPLQPGQFVAQPAILTGVTAAMSTLITGDFNGDGLPDLLFQGDPGTPDGDQVYVLESYSLSPGTLLAASTPGVTADGWAGVAGDFSGNGQMGYFSGGVIYSNYVNIPGVFTSSSVLDPNCDGCTSTLAVAADLNGDGIADLVVVWNTLEGIKINSYLSNAKTPGQFTLGSSSPFPLIGPCGFPASIPSFAPAVLTIGGFTGSGAPDVAAVGPFNSAGAGCSQEIHSSGAVVIEPGNPAAPGTFGGPSFYSNPDLAAVTAGAAGDFNGDGLTDLALTPAGLYLTSYLQFVYFDGVTLGGNGQDAVVATITPPSSSSASPTTLTVQGATPSTPATLYLVPSATVVAAGSSLTFTLLALPSVAITWSDGGTLIGTTLTDQNGNTSLTETLVPGLHTISATYAGSEFYASGIASAVVTVFGSSNRAVFRASPNPISEVATFGTLSLGETTLSWNAPSSVTNVEIHIGAPNGTLFGGGGQSGTAQTGQWVSEGMTFYLQDVTGGKPLTAANTLGVVAIHLSTTGSLFANPNPIPVPDPNSGSFAPGTYFYGRMGVTTLYWTAPEGVTSTLLTIGAPNGTQFSGGGPTGSAATGDWTTDGMTFYLQDVSGGKPLTADNSLGMVTVHLGNPPQFSASPLPGASGRTTLTWNAPNASKVAIYAVNSSGNTLVYTGGTSGSTPSIPAPNGSRFLLVDASTQQTLATVDVNPPSAQVQFYATPNPITNISLVGNVEAGVTTLNWAVPSFVTNTEIHIGAADGVLFAGGGQSGTADTGVWAQNGMTFYLQDVTGGKPLTAENTLAITTVYLKHTQVQFTATPLTNGTTTLSWDVSGVQSVDVVQSCPSCQSVGGGGASGSVTVQNIVDGAQFYLQDVTGGLPLTAANTLAIVTVHAQ